MSPATYITITVIVAVLSAMAWSYYNAMVRGPRRERAALHVIPRTAIRDLVEGASARVVGTVVASDELVRAPYTDRPCLAFRAHTKSKQLSLATGRRFSTMEPVESEPIQRVVAFRVRDDSGEVAIVVDHVKLLLEDACIDPHEATKHTPVVTSSDGKTDYHEAKLLEQQPVAVTGLVRRAADGTLQLAGTARKPLVIATRDGALEP